ncbi:hypothetical protein COE51_21480 [Bacillus pseudomycoides]|nr:hypothetical protein COE51_21480 [Bacillus pseudomycoides]
MKKFILVLLLLVNVCYIVIYFTNFEVFAPNFVWIVFFMISLCLSMLHLYRSRKQSGYNPYLAIAVLVTGISSLGAYGFRYFLSDFMG